MDIKLVGSNHPVTWHIPRTKPCTTRRLDKIIRWKKNHVSRPHVNILSTSDPACDISRPDHNILMANGEKYTDTYGIGTPTERSKHMLRQLINSYVPIKGMVHKSVYKLNSNSRRMALTMFIMIISLQQKGGSTTFEFPNEIFSKIYDLMYIAYMLYEKIDISITRTHTKVSVTNFINPVSDNIIIKLLYAYKQVDALHACCEVPLFCKQVFDESNTMMMILMNDRVATKHQVLLSQSHSGHSIQNVFLQS